MYTYNFLDIYDNLSNLERVYMNEQTSAQVIKNKLDDLNKSMKTDENKVLYKFIVDIIKCKLIFNVDNLNQKYVRYAIDVFFAGMTTYYNIPFNINILSHKHRLNRNNTNQHDETKMKLFKTSYKIFSYVVCKY